MKPYEFWLIVGALLPIAGSLILIVANRAKQTAEAAEKETQRMEAKKVDEQNKTELDRKHRELVEATFAVHKLEKTVRENEEIRARADTTGNDKSAAAASNIDDNDIKSYIAERSRNTPAEIQAQVDAHRIELEKENRALKTAIDVNSRTRSQLAALIDPIQHSIELTLKQYPGDLHISEVARVEFPVRVVFTGKEFVDGRTDSIQRMLIRYEFPNNTRLRVWLELGVIASPETLVGTRQPGIQPAHISIEVYHNESVAIGLIMFDPETQLFEARGKPYPEWEDLNRRNAKNGPLLAAEVAALVINKYQIAVAVQSAKQELSR